MARNLRERKKKNETHKQTIVVLVKNISMESTGPASTSRSYGLDHTHSCASRFKKKYFTNSKLEPTTLPFTLRLLYSSQNNLSASKAKLYDG
jgi:hypothetical protein